MATFWVKFVRREDLSAQKWHGFLHAYHQTNNINTHLFNGRLSGTTQVSWYQKCKTNLDFTGARDSEWQSSISWAICKSAPCSREITMPATHHSVFYRPDALPAAQPTASKHWRQHQQHKALKKLKELILIAKYQQTAQSFPDVSSNSKGRASYSEPIRVQQHQRQIEIIWKQNPAAKFPL